ncbi:hypothetical protein WMY93_028083 [Mugilogobius chulae]|uniref:C1q domain-containing protein n=1 Tax=Mugilogobius chulae TaxID=88201 RepID=A0AAW0N3U7_9GOBI
MNRVSVLCVLLLLGSSSGADQNNDQSQSSPETFNVLERSQSCPSDVHAVLRDMSATLAEHRVRIQQLQEVNQEQAAKLKEQAAEFKEQAVKLREQATKLRELEVKTKDVDSQQQGQAAELSSLKTRTNVNENNVASLKRDKAARQVAFSASLASSQVTFGPYSSHTPLVFKHVVSNIGNAYNPNTGFFTAPVRGAYHFEIYSCAQGQSTFSTGAVLVKNGERTFMAYQQQTGGSSSAANGITLLLESGDVVKSAFLTKLTGAEHPSQCNDRCRTLSSL